MTTSRPRNKRGDGGRLRSAILVAAGGILERTGSDDAVTLRAVAREAGVTAPALYAHFADRHDILRTVVEDTFAELAAVLRAAPDGLADPADQLRAVGRAYLDFAASRPHHYRVLFQRHRSEQTNISGTTTPHADVRTMVGADAFGVLLDAVAACTSSEVSDAPSAVQAATRVWIGLHGQATLQAALPWHPWPDRAELAREVLDRMADLT